MAPYASIVYLTKNGGAVFQRSVRAVLDQDAPFEFEVIAVDSGSTDGTLEFMKDLPIKVHTIPPSEFNFGLTRDLGFSLAAGEIVIPISQDAIPVGRQWLKLLTEPFSAPDVAVVQGEHARDPEGESFYWERVGLFYYTRAMGRWMKEYRVGLSFACCALRRRVWAENPLGPVEMSEDKVFQERVHARGYRIQVQPASRTYHSHTYDTTGLAKRCENEGLGWHDLGRTYTLLDAIRDLLNPRVLAALLYGIATLRVRRTSELLFPLVKPVFLYKGNRFTRHYVR